MSRGSGTPDFRWHLSNPLHERERITLEDAIKVYKMWSEESGAYVETDDQRITHTGFENLLSEIRENEIDMSPITLSRLVERFARIDSHILNEEEAMNLVKRYPGVAFESDDDGRGEWKALKIETIDDSVDIILRSETRGTQNGDSGEIDPEVVSESEEKSESEGDSEDESGDEGNGENESEEEIEEDMDDTEETGSGTGTKKLMLVEIAFESSPREALGTLLYERERLADIISGLVENGNASAREDIELCLITLDSDENLRKACERSGVKILELGPRSLIERVERSAEWGNLRGLTLTP